MTYLNGGRVIDALDCNLAGSESGDELLGQGWTYSRSHVA